MARGGAGALVGRVLVVLLVAGLIHSERADAQNDTRRFFGRVTAYGGSEIGEGEAFVNRVDLRLRPDPAGGEDSFFIDGVIQFMIEGDLSVVTEAPEPFCFELTSDLSETSLHSRNGVFAGLLPVDISVADSGCSGANFSSSERLLPVVKGEIHDNEVLFFFTIGEGESVEVIASELDETDALAGSSPVECDRVLRAAACEAARFRAEKFRNTYGASFTNQEVFADLERVVFLGSLRSDDGSYVIPGLSQLFPAIARLAIKVELGDAGARDKLRQIVDLVVLLDGSG